MTEDVKLRISYGAYVAMVYGVFVAHPELVSSTVDCSGRWKFWKSDRIGSLDGNYRDYYRHENWIDSAGVRLGTLYIDFDFKDSLLTREGIEAYFEELSKGSARNADVRTVGKRKRKIRVRNHGTPDR